MRGTDDTEPRRRASDTALGTRLTVVEIEQHNHNRRFEEHLGASAKLHEDAQRLIGDLDKRADRQDIAMARLLAGLAVVMILGQILAPAIAKVLGLPT